MKIQDGMQSLQQVLAKSPAAGPTQATRTGSTAHVVQEGQTLGADQANVSTTATLLAKAMATSDVRTDKVASIQSALADGSYNVSFSDVAGSIINSMMKPK